LRSFRFICARFGARALPRNGLHGSQLDSFAKELFHARYANITGRRHVRSAEHFVYWANNNRFLMPQWNDGLLDGFVRHLRQRRCAYGHAVPENQRTGASLFLRHLQAAGLISSPPADSTARPALLVSFRRWMREQRGTQDLTLYNYVVPIRTLLEEVGEDLKVPPKSSPNSRMEHPFCPCVDPYC
jgi:integrase/recombinase XerD